MIRTVRNLMRLLRIAHTLARHDALFLLEKLGVAEFVVMAARFVSRRKVEGRPGQRLAAALTEAGPSFIKLGQGLSTRSDLLGEEFAADLSELQDQLPPFDGAQARAAIEKEFGQSVEDLFASFEEKPVAAASIAQVHFAVTTDGREVAVKVLRPRIEEAFAGDLDLFFWVAELVERARPEWRRFKTRESVHTLAETVALEMDLRFEAAAAAELASNFADDPWFHVPAVDWTRTGRRVMTTERISGIPLDDRQAIIEAGHDPELVLQRAGSALFNQVFRDGFFHADLHAGNLFVRDDGGVAAVDFGIMGRLARSDRLYMGELLMAFLTRDFRRAARVHFEAGWVPAHRSEDAFTQACRSIAEPILDRPQSEISIGRLLGQLFQVTDTFEMEVQPQLLLMQKTMLVAEGTARKLSPEANMWILTRPLIEAWMIDNLGPEARIRDAAREMAEAAARLPRLMDNMDQAVSSFAKGGLKLDAETVRALRGDGTRASVHYLWIAVIALALLFAFLK